MNVLCINVDNPFGPAPGGQSVDTQEFLEPLTPDHKVRVVTLGQVCPTMGGISYESIGSRWFGRIGILDYVRLARRYVRNDVNHDVVVEFFTSPIGPIGLPLLTTRPVVGWAAFSFWDEMSAKYHIPFNRLARLNIRHYRWMGAPHQSVARKMKALVPSAQIEVLEHGMKILGEATQEREGPGTTLLFIGRPDIHQKGIDILVRALELIEIPGIKVEIAGFSADDRRWQRLMRHSNVRCEVRLLGYLGPVEKAQAYKRARLVLMPSRYESSPLVPLEAATHGVPTVAFDLPCFADRSDAMFLARAFNVEDLVGLLQRVWHDERRLDRARQACWRLVNCVDASEQSGSFRRFLLDVVQA